MTLYQYLKYIITNLFIYQRKQRMENCSSDVSAEEDNLENFTTIDSVGDGEGKIINFYWFTINK